ncbi:hypothetical protein GCK32_015854 [Trichostrongylus colubriformis]|uniref:Histone H4 n=1 Tax=Trichostrongylus colubriformis TaxID=6319 RepID=A0AAN8INL8_TRICO
MSVQRKSLDTDSPASSRSRRRKVSSTASLPSHNAGAEHHPMTRRSLQEGRPVVIVPPKPVQLKRRPVKNLPISRRFIRKIAVQGGVQRLRGDVCKESLTYLETFLDGIIADSIQYSIYGKRKTVQVEDVKNALKRRGLYVYGFDD